MQSRTLTSLLCLAYTLPASSFVVPTHNTLNASEISTYNCTVCVTKPELDILAAQDGSVKFDDFVSDVRAGIKAIKVNEDTIRKVEARFDLTYWPKAIVGLRDIVIYSRLNEHEWKMANYTTEWASKSTDVQDSKLNPLHWKTVEMDAKITIEQALNAAISWTQAKRFLIDRTYMTVSTYAGEPTYKFLFGSASDMTRSGCVSIYTGRATECP